MQLPVCGAFNLEGVDDQLDKLPVAAERREYLVQPHLKIPERRPVSVAAGTQTRDEVVEQMVEGALLRVGRTVLFEQIVERLGRREQTKNQLLYRFDFAQPRIQISQRRRRRGLVVITHPSPTDDFVRAGAGTRGLRQA